MADRDQPDFDWLYGGDGRRQGSDRQTGADGARTADDDATRVQRVQRRLGDPARGRSPRDPEPTQMLPVTRRPGAAAQHRAADRPYQTPPPTRPPHPPAGPPRVAPTPGGPPRRPRGGVRWGYVKALVAVWVVFLVVVPLVAWSRIEKVDASPRGDRPAGQPGTTYLLVGSDSREGLSRKQELGYGVGKAAGRRTDTIMLLHTGSGPNLLMSIPRDSLVPVPGHGTTKINAAYAYGGPRLLAATIENNTGIRIDDYVEIGFAGFVDVVDAVGGVRICPKQAMQDPQAGLDIKRGCQEADGPTALGYARSRHTSGLGDIARAQHQREVVSAVGAKAASPWSVLNPVRYYRLGMAGSRSLRVGDDTGMIATLRFAYAMTRVDGSNGLTCGVPISDLAVHWDPDRSERLFRLIAADRTDDVSRSLCRQSGLRSG